MPARLHIARAHKFVGTSERHPAGNSRTALPEWLQHWSLKQESSHSEFEGLDLSDGRRGRLVPHIAHKSKGALSSERRASYSGPSHCTRSTSVPDPTTSWWLCRSSTMSPCRRPSRFGDRTLEPTEGQAICDLKPPVLVDEAAHEARGGSGGVKGREQETW